MTYPVEYKHLTERESCIIQAKRMGATTKEAKQQCMSCDNKTKIRYAVSAYGIFEDDREEPLDQTTTIRFIGKGAEIENMFIEAQVKRGDTRKHAQKLATGIMAFVSDRAVKDSEGNVTSESVFYYTHDSLGKREFHKIEKPEPEPLSPLELATESRRAFGDSPINAKSNAEWIMTASQEYDKTVTPLTLKLRAAFNRGQTFMQTRELMANWEIERRNINKAIAERERKKQEQRFTVGNLYGEKPHSANASTQKKLFKDFNDKHLTGKGERGFPLHNRKTVGNLYKPKGRGEINFR